MVPVRISALRFSAAIRPSMPSFFRMVENSERRVDPRRVHSGFRRGYGGQVGDAGNGDNREDPSGVFRPEQADQDDLPRVSGVAKGCAQGDPVAGDRVSL